MLSSSAQGAYSGTRASYVALSAMSILALALLSSMWTSDVSGSVALLGLLAIYLSSQELLMLFVIFSPLSILFDIIRLAGVPHSTNGRGWLIFIQLLEMAAKAAGALFAWSLHRSAGSGEGLPSYAPVGPSSYPPGPGPAGGGGGAAASTYGRVDDPFAAAYAPPNPLPQAATPPPTLQQPSHPPTFRPQPPSSQPAAPPQGALAGAAAPQSTQTAAAAAGGAANPAAGATTNIITLE